MDSKENSLIVGRNYRFTLKSAWEPRYIDYGKLLKVQDKGNKQKEKLTFNYWHLRNQETGIAILGKSKEGDTHEAMRRHLDIEEIDEVDVPSVEEIVKSSHFGRKEKLERYEKLWAEHDSRLTRENIIKVQEQVMGRELTDEEADRIRGGRKRRKTRRKKRTKKRTKKRLKSSNYCCEHLGSNGGKWKPKSKKTLKTRKRRRKRRKRRRKTKKKN